MATLTLGLLTPRSLTTSMDRTAPFFCSRI